MKLLKHLLKCSLKFLNIGSDYPTYHYKDEVNKEKKDEPN